MRLAKVHIYWNELIHSPFFRSKSHLMPTFCVWFQHRLYSPGYAALWSVLLLIDSFKLNSRQYACSWEPFYHAIPCQCHLLLPMFSIAISTESKWCGPRFPNVLKFEKVLVYCQLNDCCSFSNTFINSVAIVHLRLYTSASIYCSSRGKFMHTVAGEQVQRERWHELCLAQESGLCSYFELKVNSVTGLNWVTICPFNKHWPNLVHI